MGRRRRLVIAASGKRARSLPGLCGYRLAPSAGQIGERPTASAEEQHAHRRASPPRTIGSSVPRVRRTGQRRRVMIAAIAVVARAVIAVTLLVAGVAKARDRAGTRAALTAFGCPARLVGAVAVALPVVEIAIACLLVPSATAAVGLILALALLGAFTLVVAVALARGRRPPCRCFGELSAAPIGPQTLVRNIVLVAVAAIGLTAQLTTDVPDAAGWAADQRGASLVALMLAAALVAVVVAGGLLAISLLASYGRVLQRVERLERAVDGLDLDELPNEARAGVGLAPGTAAPDFELPAVEDGDVSLDRILAAGRRVLLVFASPGCGPCHALLPTVGEWQREHESTVTVVVAFADGLDGAREVAAEHGLSNVLADEGGHVADTFAMAGTPGAVLVDPDGTVAEWGAAGGPAVEELFDRALAPPPARVGDPLPDLPVATLDGNERQLAELVGGRALVLFWNPSCGFCRQMHDSLRRFEDQGGHDGLQLLIVSSGPPEEVAAEGFASTVVVDGDYRISAALGSVGTPSAVLIDERRRVASAVAAGADAVFELAGRSPRLELHAGRRTGV
jgi:thiol-disulfide isomerase/thioredoxin